jgi:PAS domain S-box-containing protein
MAGRRRSYGKTDGDLKWMKDRLTELEREREEHRKLLEALRHECSQFETIIRNVNEYIYSADYGSDGVVSTYHSPQCLEVTGYTPDEYSASRDLWFFMIHEGDRENVNRLLRDVLSTGRTSTIEHRILHKTKGIRWVSNTCSVETDESGATRRLNGFVLDITEKKRAEEKLKESEERYRSLFENNHAVMLLIDPESGDIVDANPAAVAYYGYGRDKLRRMRILDINTLSAEEVLLEMRRAKREERRSFFFRHRLAGGEIRDVEVYSGPIRSNGRALLYSIVHDITDRKRAEEALRLSEESLRKRTEMFEKDLRIAQMIQKVLLPGQVPENSRLKIDWRFIPFDAVGGDFFSFSAPDNGSMGIFIGDVAGHGISSALFLSLIKNATSRVALEYNRNPRGYIKRLNDELCEYMQSYFMTAIYGLFTARAGDSAGVEFTFANGGHPSPIYQDITSGETRFLDADGSIIGVFSDADFNEARIELARGDRIYLYTDGLVEARNEQGLLFGFDELPSLVREVSTPALTDTLDAILGEINKFKGSMRFDDDVVLIGVEVI